MTLACRMLLHDLDSDAYDRDVCLSSAREIAGIIKLWIRQMKIDEVKDQRSGVGNGRLTNRGKHGLAGPYVLNLWYWTADRLIRGGRLLRGTGAEKGEYEYEMECEARSAEYGERAGDGRVQTNVGNRLIVSRVDWMRRRRKDDYRWVQVARTVLSALVSDLCAGWGGDAIVIAMAVPR
jgi:hypothetical protein